LAEHAAGQLPASVFMQLREALAAEAAAGRDGDDGVAELAGVLDALRAAERRVAEWPLDDADHDTLLAGVRRAYARGCAARADACAHPTPERLHAWRKRAKDLWYHQRLLASAWPGVLKAQAREAHALTELLGDDHDLAVLIERLGADAPPLTPAVDAERPALRTLAEQRSAALRAAAERLGERVYAESPKAFSRRLGRYVHAAVAERRAGESGG
jgi:CHAD domain-containing protein